MRDPIRRARGMTLIELLVAMAIGLIVTLAVTTLVTVGEAQKRTALATNDMGQNGAYAAYVIDRAVRSAGSGLVQSSNLGVFGCRLSATRTSPGTVAVLPRTEAFPVPFAGFLGGGNASATTGSGSLRFAPLLIGKEQGANRSDILVVMGGNAAAGDVPRPIRAGSGTNDLRLDNTIGLANGDLVMVSQEGTQDCLIEQVNDSGNTLKAVGNDVVPVGGTYVTPTGATTSLSTLTGSSSAYMTTLGNLTARNVQFQLIGANAQRTLVSYDLLRMAGTGSDADAQQSLADGVIGLYAIYGVDTDNNGLVDDWIDPGANDYTIATVMTTPATMRKILAVRVALVLRSSIPQLSTQQNTSTADLAAVSASSLTLFGDLAEAKRRTVTLPDTNYRYRVVDTTIPLRNMSLQP